MTEPLVEDTGGIDYASIGEELLAEPSTEVGTSGATEALDYQGPQEDLEFDIGSLGGLRESGKSHFNAAIQRGMDMQQANLAALAGAVGDVTGQEGMAEWGYEEFAEQMKEAAMNPAVVESWEDVHNLADFGTFVVEAVGENVPNLLVMATGGGIGINAAKAGIGKKLLQNAAANQAKIKAKKKLGALVGTTAANYPLSTGEIAGEFHEADLDPTGTIFVAGAVNTGLDVLGFNKIVGAAFGGGPIRNAKQLVMEGLKGWATAGVTEFGTEATQEAVQMVARAYEDPTFELYTEENKQRLINAGAKGFAAGGTVGGAGAVISGVGRGSAEAAAEAGKNAKDYLESQLDPTDRDPSPQGPITPASTGLTVPEDQFAAGDMAAAFGVEGNLDEGLTGALGDLAARASRGEDIFTPENQAKVDAAVQNRKILPEDLPEGSTVRVKAEVEGRQVEVEMPAAEALANVEKEADAYSQLRKCLS